VLTRAYHYDLPADRIAQYPAADRDQSRLLILHRGGSPMEHHTFSAFPNLLRPGDLLILNDSRVIPARLRGVKESSGGAIEILLLEENAPLDWWVMLRPGKRVRPGTRLRFLARDGALSDLNAEVMEKNGEGWCRLRFQGVTDLRQILPLLGEIPLPPYLSRASSGEEPPDRIRYQTVYARKDGSVAAPTAGLHFTPALLDVIRGRGVDIQFVTLHVGHGTFAPVKSGNLEEHRMHEEWYEVPPATADAWQRARTEGRRVVAVGTTSVRVLESVGRANSGQVVAGSGRTRIFLHPPQTFTAVDALLTNFHLPESTLLMLVSAFVAPGENERGRLQVLEAYREAIRLGYRFFSYGDAMFIA
jgi:S-adenosylmethionine:tRNA ribosyltransferase-isomerase